MLSILGVLNRLLPFATPGTPLIQDLIHLASICTFLYFAPQIQEWMQQRQHQRQHPGQDELIGDRRGQEEPQINPVNDREPETQQVADQQIPNDEHPPPAEPQPRANDEMIQEGHPRPADLPQPNAVNTQRNVGAKKAKSLARKDQRRAYHEFQRSQGETQRAREAEGAAEREAQLAKDRARRKAAEDEINAEKAKERERRRVLEMQARKDENKRRELVVDLVKEGLDRERMVDLFKVARQAGDDVDEEWVERILNASGLLEKKGGVLKMVTTTGWAIRVSEEDVQALYAKALEAAEGSEEGISHEDLAGLLRDVLKDRAIHV